jgi:hypothetical protein
MGKLVLNWERIKQEAFTSIRKDFTVETLIKLEAEGNYTPVSGDSLAAWKR